MQPWFASVLRDGFAAQLAGQFVSFKQLAEAHLAHLLAERPHAPKCGPPAPAAATSTALPFPALLFATLATAYGTPAGCRGSRRRSGC